MKTKRAIGAIMLLNCHAPAAGALATPATPSYVSQALKDPDRPPQQVQQDAWRRPAELMAFAGIKPDWRIADFMSGAGYFTRLFSRAVGPRGRIYAVLPTQQLASCAPEETAGTQALQGDRRYGNVRVLIQAADRFTVPESLDLVFTSQNYHDLHDRFMAPTDIAAFNAAIYKALKPGGVFLIIDHAATPGSGLRDTETLHRIDPSSIQAEVTAAGFVFESQSSVLRMPADSHTLSVFDPAVRHRTDQVAMKFRKPARINPLGAD